MPTNHQVAKAIRISKLPQWAQQEIKRLENSVEHWKAQATAGPEGSNTFIRRYGNKMDTPLGSSPIVRFQLGEGWHEAVEVQIEKGFVHVRGSDGITIWPSAANCIDVRPGRLW